MADASRWGGLSNQLTPAQYSRISQLLDESIELSPAGRETWLADLHSRDPAAADLLRQLFARQEDYRAGRFLEDSGHLTHLASVPGAESAGVIGKQFGPYRALSLLGHGGMGSVWLAERVDGLFTRRVALKLVHPALLGRAIAERLAREREIVGSLDHPHIARLFDAGFAADGQPYLALEYVAGTPFTTYCDEHRLPLRARLELFQQVLSAVQYAHAHLVIHRDIKPSNILVTSEGTVHLLDFGIAKLLTEGTARETELTQVGGRALTPEYAAPEQILGAPITTAADVYALGVMLYELLTGERPYRLKRDSRGALEEAILQVDPVAPSRAALGAAAAAARATTPRKLAKSLNGDLDTIALKALKKAPLERYATANAFGEDIARYLSGNVVLARPDSIAYRTRKFVRRHRMAIAAGGILLLTLAGGLAATTYEAAVASGQRDEAFRAHLRLLTQTAAERLKTGDLSGAMGIMLEVLPRHGESRAYAPEALGVFEEARAADAQLLAFVGHADKVNYATFSPDGQRIVTASADKTARIWDAASGREILRLSGHSAPLSGAAFSPDGGRIVTAADDKTARIWDAATGSPLAVLGGHADAVTSAAFSPDGRRIVTASADKTVRIWDAATGRPITVLSGHTDRVASAAFSPDGRRIVTAADDKTARIWDAASGRQLALLSGHRDRAWFAAFSPDGGRIVTASYDKSARIWDAATGKMLHELAAHTGPVSSAVFSHDGRLVVTASTDQTARIWDAATGSPVSLLSGHTDRVWFAEFSPDDRRVLTGSDDRTARLWQVAPRQQIGLLSGHSAAVTAAHFSPDGRRVLTASDDTSARIWDAATGREIAVLRGHAAPLPAASFSPDGRRIVTASTDKTARVWDVATSREILRLTGHTDQVTAAAFSGDGRRIVTASVDRTARTWDATTGQPLALLSGHTDLVAFAAFSPDGERIATASSDKTARIWDARTGQSLLILRGHTGLVWCAVFSRDGRRLVTASSDKTVRIWDTTTGAEIERLSEAAGVAFAALSPDDRQVVTASDDMTARIWDLATGLPVLVFSGHTDTVQMAQFAPDGQRVVTASDDETARIWDARAPPVDTQISWAAAAQFDPLPSTERFELGLSEHDDGRHVSNEKSAQAGDLDALVRHAEGEDAAAAAETDTVRRTAHWLEAFKYYAAASERARSEDRPDEQWRNWRYRRASLARLLARDGRMAEVADAYESMRARYAAGSHSAWDRIRALSMPQ